MIEKIIAFLQWIQASESLKKWVDRFFSFLILFVSATLIWTFYKEVIGNCSRYSGCSDLFPWDTLFQMILGGFLTLSIAGSIVYGAWKKLWSTEYSVMRLLLNTTLPFVVGFLLLTLSKEYGNESSYGPKWYIYLFGGLYALSPILHFMRDNTRGEGLFMKSLQCYNKYIVSFLIGLAIFTVLFGLSTIFDEMRYMDFSEIVLLLFIVFCIFSLATWLILTYAWDEVKPLDESASRSIRKGAVWMAALFLFIWISPDWKESFIDNRITKAEEILQKSGQTQESYKDAASVWGLKWAMKERYLENNLYNKDLYARIFDRSIESDIEDEIDVNKYRTWNSNGTSMLARGENAKVELNFAKHESEIKSDIGAMETTVTYEFQNTDSQNQEVIYSIELPTSDAVVTDLRLGLNLELTGTLAPRGAAEQVYVDSLRRNTDPALLEQTGPTTYRLRVFPVPSVNDTRTQGRQRVQFRYVTPITSGEDITVIPKTDILNLKLTKKSEIMIRVMEGTKALVQDSTKTDDIKDLIAGKTVSVKLEGALKDSLSYCAVNTYEGLDMKSFSGSEKNITKNIVFLDVSKSAGEDANIAKRYQELVDTWKNNGAALDIYTFNGGLNSAGYDLSDLEFWGNTDMATVIAKIAYEGISNANVVILTDDDSYEVVNTENKAIDYQKMKSNRISLIVIGENIRTLKTEVTKAILASEGNVLRLAPGASLDEGIKSIFAPKQAPSTCEPYTGSQTGTLSALEGNRDGKKVFGNAYSYTGEIETEKVAYSQYRYSTPSFEALSKDGEGGPLIRTIIEGSILEGVEYEVAGTYNYTSGSIFPSGYTPREGLLAFDYTGKSLIFQIYKDGKLVQEDRKYLSKDDLDALWKKTFYTVSEGSIQIEDEQILEKIGTTAHIVNQSMSLIALENDRQRQDLERYSNQEDKYDTTYQNFDNTNQGGSPRWDRREMMMSDMAMPTSISMERTRPASANSTSVTFGASKATEMQLGSTSSSAGMLSLGGGGGNQSTLLQILAIIILFPVMAWYVLRKKKPQAVPETEKQEQKPE